ncbi:DinB family protein [Brevibacillus fulvus]|uniref:DinB-like domain-containing protein n=1 Tax=Brevibacillus fulvus TaxID=1125967 RepID=A0A938Y2E5_9BACL|nr:DinB family protein [Brevibacillus fulvus]MBM7589960.1 hypothetical protein [Brevibacillus fulvus]
MSEQKRKILEHYEQSIAWASGLRVLTEEQWRTPIAEGKWTIAEIIGHLHPWDEFVVSQRLPYLFKNAPLPKGPNAEDINQQAAAISRKRTKEDTISEFVAGRRKLITAIEQLEDELWTQTFRIGQTELSLFSYFSSLAEHDEHHFGQIRQICHARS